MIVGARCAGSSLAVRLARGGWRVAVVDKARFPSDTLSTHVIFPDGVARLDELGALKRLELRHDLAPARYSWRVLGHEVAGSFTPVGGHDRALSVRRVSLDAVLVDAGRGGRLHHAAGPQGHRARRLRHRPGPGPRSRARRRSASCGRAGSWARTGSARAWPTTWAWSGVEERRGELAMLLGYWRGLPASDWIRLDMHERSAFMAAPCEDGLHLLTVAGPADLTRGTPAALEARYRQALLDFPAVLNPRLLAAAELVSPVVGAPETMMRGYYRSAAGPGWALVGDAGHFKHPTTGQGIGDALAQAEHVALDLLGGGDLAGYEQWRAERSTEAYEFSFRAARLPEPLTAARYAGLAADPVAGQQFLDTFTRRTGLSDVFTRERSRRWRAAAAYEDGLRRLVALVDGLPDPGPADPGSRLSAVVGAGPRRPPVRGRRGFHPRAVLRRSDAGLGRSRARRAAGGLDGRAGRGPS